MPSNPSYIGTGDDIVPIAPNDSSDLATPARAIRCKPTTGQSGTIRVTTGAGAIRNTEITQGETLNVFVTRVHTTGTTATGLEAII